MKETSIIMQMKPEIDSNLSGVFERDGLKRSIRSRIELSVEEEMLKGTEKIY